MFNLFKHFFTRVAPLGIVAYNHLYLEESGWNMTLMAWIISAIIIYFLFLKPMNEKVRMWEYQKDNEFFVINYKQIKYIVLFAMLYFLWNALHANYEEIQQTLLLIIFSLILGWVFALLGYKINVGESE